MPVLRFDSGSPSSGLGDLGDMYIDVSTSLQYGPKTVSGWGSANPLDATAINGVTVTGTPSSGQVTGTGGTWAEGTLGTSQTLVAGDLYYLAVLVNCSVNPKFYGNGSSNVSTAWAALNGSYTDGYITSTTSFPASFTPSALTPDVHRVLIYGR